MKGKTFLNGAGISEPTRALILSGSGGHCALHAGVNKYLMDLENGCIDSADRGRLGAAGSATVMATSQPG
jgi:hypothetical protein